MEASALDMDSSPGTRRTIGVSTRDQRLDILRAVAVLLVLGRHVPFFPYWTKIGWIGVDLFFVISGFLISGLLFEEFTSFGAIRMRRFYLRRALKIYPPFYCMIFVTILVSWYLHDPIRLEEVGAELLFMQNYFKGIWDHTWSLAVEEHFYLMLPPMLCLMIRNNSANPFRRLPSVYCLAASVILVMRLFTADTNFHHYFYPTHLRLDELLLGVVISYYRHFENGAFVRVARWPLLPAASFLLILPALSLPVENHFLHTVGLTMLALGFAGILMTFTIRGRNASELKVSGTIPRALAGIGVYSYSIYLWHVPVMAWGLPLIRQLAAKHTLTLRLFGVSYFFMYVAASIVVGIGMAKLVEMPVLAWRDRFFPSRSH